MGSWGGAVGWVPARARRRRARASRRQPPISRRARRSRRICVRRRRRGGADAAVCAHLTAGRLPHQPALPARRRAARRPQRGRAPGGDARRYVCAVCVHVVPTRA